MKTRSSLSTPLMLMLTREHRHIERALAVLMAIGERFSDRRPVALADLKTLTTFFKEYADTIHHHAEEQLLFPAVEDTNSRTLNRMTGKLATQHMMGRLLAGSLREYLPSRKGPSRSWQKRFVSDASALNTLLSIHICDEDHLFFPRVEQVLASKGNLNRLTKIPRTTGKRRWETEIRRLYEKYRPATSSPCSHCSSGACAPD